MDFTDVDWQLIVVDNAGDEETKGVCDEFVQHLPIEYLVCVRPGKNAALNSAMPKVSGKLVVFTDDDVLPDPNWLMAMRDGAMRWPDHVLFAGRILPEWPSTPPKYVLDFAAHPDIGRWTYSVLDINCAEGPIQFLLPIGNNMAVRRTVFDSGLRFNEYIGPRGNSYAMGSETEFNLRLRALGHHAVYLPNAVVHHQIRPNQLDRSWLVGRAYREGRGEARLHPDSTLIGTCRALLQILRALRTQLVSSFCRQTESAFFARMQRARVTGWLSESLRMKFNRF
jgi:GT2 family glycosyltransferase